jgi:hypothetical protein
MAAELKPHYAAKLSENVYNIRSKVTLPAFLADY